MSQEKTKRTSNGVQLNIFSEDYISDLRPNRKIEEIIESVKDGNVVILESGLSPDEQSKLIETTMTKIDPHTDFNGIEIETYPKNQTEGGLFNKLLGRDDSETLTVIAPESCLETLHKDENIINAFVKQRG